MVTKFMPFFTEQPLPTKQQVSVTLGQVYGLLANQMVGAIPGVGTITDPNTPALTTVLLGDNQRGGAYPLFVRLGYPIGTEDFSFPLHVTLTRGSRNIVTNRRSSISTTREGRQADYEVESAGGISVGTWPDGFASIGDTISIDFHFEAPPTPEPDNSHAYSIVVGTGNSSWTGTGSTTQVQLRTATSPCPMAAQPASGRQCARVGRPLCGLP